MTYFFMNLRSLRVDLFRHFQVMLLHVEQFDGAFSSMLVNLSTSKTFIILGSVLFHDSSFTLKKLPFAASDFAIKLFSHNIDLDIFFLLLTYQYPQNYSAPNLLLSDLLPSVQVTHS